MNLPQSTESLLAHALGAVSEGFLISDAARNIIYSNGAFAAITGYEQSEIVGVNCLFLQGPATSPDELQRMRNALDAAEVFQGTLLNYRKDGTPFWNHLTITPLTDADGSLTHFVSVQRDVTDIIEERERLSHAASHDQLTGLPHPVGHLVMFMQPIVDLHTGLVGHVEALARLRKPDGSIELPESFLPHYSTQQLVELFKEGLDQSLAWVSRWERDGVELNVSVNIPPELLNTPDSVDWVRDALARHGIRPHRLSLELLEDQELDLAASAHTVAELVRLGVKIYLDDLNSGFSTLQRITEIPFDVLKIDRQVFDQAHTRPLLVLAILAAITTLGSEAGYGVVVEGIENREQLEACVVLGAQYGQGYLFARPMPPEDVAEWVASFTMPYRDGTVATPFGALAYHWAHSREGGPTRPDRAACLLTEYFSHADPHIMALHDSLHSAADRRSPASTAITAWLVDRVQRSETGD